MSLNWASLTGIAVARKNQFWDIATNNDQYLFRMLPRFPKSEAGKCSWFNQTAASQAKGFREGQNFKNPDQMTPTKFELPLGYFHQVARITGHHKDRLEAMGDTQIGNELAKVFQDHTDSLIRAIEAALYLGDDTDSEFVGFGSAIDDSNIYAGVDRSTNTIARSFVSTNSGTPRSLTTTLINAAHKGIRHTNRGNYDTIICSPTQGDNLRGLTADVHKLGGQVFVQPGQPMELSIGIGTVTSSGLKIKGADVFEIPGYPTDRIDFMLLKPGRHIGLEVHRDFTISDVRRDNDDMVWDLTYACQLVVRNPRMATGRIEDLS